MRVRALLRNLLVDQQDLLHSLAEAVVQVRPIVVAVQVRAPLGLQVELLVQVLVAEAQNFVVLLTQPGLSAVEAEMIVVDFGCFDRP